MGRPGPVTVLEYEPFPDPSEETVTISARFQNENGMALREGEACLPRVSAPAFPGAGRTPGFPQPRPGESRVSGLPREGTLDLPSCDRRDREQDVFFLGSGD